MPVQIGAKTHNFTDPTGLLSDCHRRVEMFLGTLEAVANVIDRPATEETRRGLESALRYFAQAAPRHTADEEESLFPRLRQIHHPEIESAFSKLDHLEDEHRWAAPLHAKVERIGMQYLSSGNLSSPEVEEFRKAVASLASMYKQHIAVEDSLVFPLAARILSNAEKIAIAEEMAARRKVRVVTEIPVGRK
ncbi:MAG TPA: hemerythrin domain-containing protein [Candidatus Dormibacteraeota bacterium]|nr:hemerythrin domain-containing protein [Candidatus Dormibacteraeota bacterium]